jgi:hypothetical protein
VKFSFVLLLVVFAILLSDSSESSEPKLTNPPVAQNDKPKAKNDQKIDKPHPPQMVATPTESAILKALSGLIDEEKAKYEEQKADDKRWWPPSATWAVVYVTIAYVIVAICQWAAIRRQANIAERSITELERPWLIVQPGHLDWPFKQGGVSANPPFVVTIRWSAINTGRSPAFLTNLSVSFVCAPIPVESERPEYELFNDFAEMPIPPNGAHSGEQKVQITDSVFEDIKNYKSCLKFYGFLEYHDPSRKNLHKTRFCAYWYMLNSSFPWMLTFVPVGPRDYIEYT